MRTPFYSQDILAAEQLVPDGDPTGLSSVITVTGLNDTLDFIEYIDIEITLSGTYGNLLIELTSPQDKTSILAERHFCTRGTTGYMECVIKFSDKAAFGSARHLGESPDGDWTLEVIDKIYDGTNRIYSWGLKFYGHKKP